MGDANGEARKIDGTIFKLHKYGDKNPNWSGGTFQDCEICGEPFWKYPSRKQPTCSVECGGKRGSLVKKGLLQSSGHKQEYGGRKHWELLRGEILLRDNYTCQECDIYLKDKSSMLHVHHIKRLVDGGLNEKSNLITLCYKCHAKEHKFDLLKFNKKIIEQD